ncbi:hypothetical protein AB0I72_19675 [Nocardiopsis sp. NPDC049922]|uniref:hypothetical protein n=1 Tax=Nocardiopsis sp. NPDC049922 TaxID=3155157 RepID=UPI0033DF7CDE
MRFVHANRIRREQRQYAEQAERDTAVEVDEHAAEVLADADTVLEHIDQTLADDADTVRGTR